MCSPEFVKLIRETDCLYLQETKCDNLDNNMIDKYYKHRRDVSQR